VARAAFGAVAADQYYLLMKCAVCGSERLSPLAEVRSCRDTRGIPELQFDRKGFFTSRPTFRATLARACRDCGAVQYFLTKASRTELDQVADQLDDVRSAQAEWD
jgi:hypothetical protein